MQGLNSSSVSIRLKLCRARTVNTRPSSDLVLREKSRLANNRFNLCGGSGIVDIRLSLDLVSNQSPRLASSRLNHCRTRIINTQLGLGLFSMEKPRFANSRLSLCNTSLVSTRLGSELVSREKTRLAIMRLDLRGSRTVNSRFFCVLVFRERIGRVLLKDRLSNPFREVSEVLVGRTIANSDAFLVRLLLLLRCEPVRETFLNLFDFCGLLFFCVLFVAPDFELPDFHIFLPRPLGLLSSSVQDCNIEHHIDEAAIDWVAIVESDTPLSVS
jgi:hypothetical protein